MTAIGQSPADLHPVATPRPLAEVEAIRDSLHKLDAHTRQVVSADHRQAVHLIDAVHAGTVTDPTSLSVESWRVLDALADDINSEVDGSDWQTDQHLTD